MYTTSPFLLYTTFCYYLAIKHTLSRKEILSLKQESEQIDKILRLAQSDQNQNGDECDLDQLLTFMEKLDDYQRLCAAEEREIKDLDNQVYYFV